ncbi:Sugar fermentation stimulation protein SfsA [hydrothermal vent metagenome]|uniref:Sugar fermentation stimulation protein SfsA n=1 Tax=hydrothermal vent metagenome TaxID=652676 RepID=A0A3B0TGD7_9ZZZZ
MIFEQPLVHGTLIRRYKRFLADVELDDGSQVVAHCTNSGSMKSCLEEGAEVYLTPVNNPKRKTRFTWEMIKINGDWVGVNTSHPNRLAYDAVREGQIPGLEGYTSVKREVGYGDSRFDIYAEKDGGKCFIEVKNVTMKEGSYALFPDAVTSRGLKHLQTLMVVKSRGVRAVMLYIIQRSDVAVFAPAKEIDPDYSKALKEAYNCGVEIIPVQAKVTPGAIELTKGLPFEL